MKLISYLALFCSLLVVSGCHGNTGKSKMNSYANFDQRARNGETLSVIFFGGSLTWGAQATDPMHTSYRALIMSKLQDTYPKARFKFRDAAIGGTGSQLGAFRVERDVLSHKPDLVFLDFTVNDGAYTAPEPDRLASYESIVRKITQSRAPIVQVILPVKPDVLPNPPARPIDSKHKEIGHAYGLAIADAVALAQSRVANGSVTPDQLWDAPPDTTHPGDPGYALYADAVWDALQKGISQKMECKIPAVMLHADTYMTLNRFKLSNVKPLPQGWKVGQPTRWAVAFDFTPSRWMDSVIVASRAKDDKQSPAPLVFSVRGSNISLFGEATKISGKYRALIDGKEVKAVDIGKMSTSGAWRYFEILAEGLDPAVAHRVEIIPDLAPEQELRFESLCVAGSDAIVEVQ